MAKIIRYLLTSIAALLALSVIAAVLIGIFFDPNDYREEIAAQFSQELGRKVRIEGEIKLNVFPWIVLSVADVSVAAAKGFGEAPMLSFANASGSLRLFAALRGNLEVGTLSIDGLKANLQVNKAGVKSWSDITDKMRARSAQPDQQKNLTDDKSVLSVAGIQINDATISYSDHQAGGDYKLTSVNLQVEAVDLNGPVPFESTFDFSIEPGSYTGSAQVSATASIAATEDREGSAIALADFNANGSVLIPEMGEAHAFSMNSDLFALDTSANRMKLNKGPFVFGPLVGEVALAGEGPLEPVKLEGEMTLERVSVRKVMRAFAQEVPETTDPDVLKSLSGSGKITLTLDWVAFKDLSLVLDDTRLKGTARVDNFSNQAYSFNLSADAINLDRYMPPVEGASVGTKKDGGDNLAQSDLPVDLIRDLTAKGNLVVQRLTLGELPFDNLQLGVNVANKKARLHPINATVLSGRYSGDVSIDASTAKPRLSLNESVQGLDLGELARLLWERQNIAGTLTGKFTLAGRGETLADIRKSLAGDIVFDLSDGALKGTDIWYQIRRARATLKNQPAPVAPSPLMTRFSSIRGSAVVKDGIATNKDLFAELPFMQLTGAGTVSLADGMLDYSLKARVLERPEFLTNATPEELNEYTEAVIPLRITGNVASPTIRPDIAGMAKEAAAKRLREEQEKAKKRLLDRLGGSEQPLLDEAAKKEEELKKKLRDLFGG